MCITGMTTKHVRRAVSSRQLAHAKSAFGRFNSVLALFSATHTIPGVIRIEDHKYEQMGKADLQF
jgi:hypothetical protein